MSLSPLNIANIPQRPGTPFPFDNSIPAADTTTQTPPISSSPISHKATLHPNFVNQDKSRKLHEERIAAVEKESLPKTVLERKSLSKVLLNDNQALHQAVESAPLVNRLKQKTATKEEYLQYLVNLRYGIAVLEPYLKENSVLPWMKPLDFKPYFRLEALKKDIEAMGIKKPLPCILCIENKHLQHLDDLQSKKPYLLVAHAAIRYLAILFGGQQRAERLKVMWEGTKALNLYQFKEKTEVLRKKLMENLDTFGNNLSDEQYKSFLVEIKTAWEFAGDILNHNIRK